MRASEPFPVDRAPRAAWVGGGVAVVALVLAMPLLALRTGYLPWQIDVPGVPSAAGAEASVADGEPTPPATEREPAREPTDDGASP